jgi:hypothetical protein
VCNYVIVVKLLQHLQPMPGCVEALCNRDRCLIGATGSSSLCGAHFAAQLNTQSSASHVGTQDPGVARMTRVAQTLSIVY